MKKSKNSLLRFLAPYASNKWGWLVLGIVASLIIVVFNLVRTAFIENIINTVTDPSLEFNELYTQIIILLVVVVLGLIASYFEVYSINKFEVQTIQQLKNTLHKKILDFDILAVEKSHSGDIASSLTNEISTLSNFLQNDLLNIVSQPLLFICGFLYMLHINILLTFSCLIIVPICIIITRKITKSLENYSRKNFDCLSKANVVSQDYVNGVSTARAFNLEKNICENYKQHLENALSYQKKIFQINSKMLPFIIMLYELPIMICAVVGSLLAIKGKIEPGSLIAFIYLLRTVVQPLASLPNLVVSYLRVKGGISRIVDLQSLAVEKKNPLGTGTIDNHFENAVEFKNVSFGYSPQKKIIDDVSFKIPKGAKVGFVGPSGGGKSTIINLLCAFYPEYEGSIRVLGREIKEWDVDALRKNISYVSQRDYLFSESIYNNIQIGNLQATSEEIYEAAKKSAAYQFITQTSNGFFTNVGSGGTKLSGGETQRISFARAIIKHMNILLLDEATSALDPKSESVILKTIHELPQSVTKVIVAHRLKTVQDADMIYVFDQSRIVESGTHESLIKQKGLYYTMFQNQENIS
ncbi:MAG TPA: ABC transporter ATP-binding protein [Candidatus Gallacutalibacter stercoravium]|nr:ABC transporter ATP-binding protein [Candidatus Gallacutalibacter stercoravium]